MQLLLVLLVLPTNPCIAASQGRTSSRKQQAAEFPSLLVQDVIAQVWAERLRVAEVVVPGDHFVPFFDRILIGHNLQDKRCQLLQIIANDRLRRTPMGPGDLLARPSLLCLVDGR